jgi:hypothetical protein
MKTVYLTFIIEDYQYPDFQTAHATLESATSYVEKELIDSTCVKINDYTYKGASFRVAIVEKEILD